MFFFPLTSEHFQKLYIYMSCILNVAIYRNCAKFAECQPKGLHKVDILYDEPFAPGIHHKKTCLLDYKLIKLLSVFHKV
jgi:hypothetical protein